ncbi:MAG: Ig-like domain-containing protein [Candidatus Faecousia sp.]|nr:Ig-like domain-containing protein [Bacillota bacterium]MDY2557484.1 Ig-like domain-containing protein [Candidatus Faecousia sp.]
MSKIICDVCGTSYPDTADCCPICGCSKDTAGSLLGEDLLEQTAGESTGTQEYPRKRKEIFDYDEVNSEPEEEEVTYAQTEYDEEEEDDGEEEPRQNTLVVIILTVLIALLLMAAGFIFVRYFLPNMGSKADAALQTTQETQAAVTETTELSIPCQELYIISGKTVELNEEGQMFLLHVKASPENTTDKILFTSSDEAVATVTEDGRITAVSEGEAVITIRCGVSTMECPVTVKYVEETTEAATEAIETVAYGETGPEETAADSGDGGNAVETTVPANASLKNVTLKLKKTDIRLGVYYEYKLLLDCDLEQNEVQWSSEHPYIASVDENGVVKAIKSGTTAITATYGDQKVQCIVRCS